MVSDLYWHMGFGWTSVILLICSIIGAATFPAPGQGLFGLVAIIAIIYMFKSYRNWNGTLWKQSHGRGMLLYRLFEKTENSQSKKEHRPFSMRNACYMMAEKMCGEEKSLEISAMIDYLQNVQGNYLRDLILSYPVRDFQYIADAASKIKFCPQLIIANIIQNTYGPEEAAQYAIALATGKAKI